MEQFVEWWIKHKADGEFDQPEGAAGTGGAAGGGSGLTGMFSRFGRKKKRDVNKIYPEPLAEPEPEAKPALP